MKRSILFVVAALIASPVFAAEDMCESKLKDLDNYLSVGGAVSESAKDELKDLREKADAAKNAGNKDDCVKHADMALDQIDKIKKGGQ